MPAAQPVETTTPQSAGEWDEARCIDALRHLEELQEKVDELRLAIPRIIQPFRTEQPSPAHLLNGFKKAAEDAAKDLDGFKLAWQSGETKTVFKRAKQSYKNDHDLSAGAKIPKYGWSSHSQLPNPAATTTETKNESDVSNAPELDSSADVVSVVEEYKAAHPKFKVLLESDNQIIKIQYKVPSMVLKFVITRQKDTTGKQKLEAECQGTSRLTAAITRCIASRPRSEDLRYLLDMIAAYNNARTATCSRCNKMLDEAALTPAARRPRNGETTIETPETEWQAVHESCLA